MTYKPKFLTPAEGGLGASTTATSGKMLQGNGATWGASTPTFPTTAGTSANVMTSDGTNWTSAPPSGGTWGGYTVTTVTGTLTNAQIKALHGTPVQIVAAQGAGTLIIPVMIMLKMAYGGTNVFVAAASQTISLAYNTNTAYTILTSAGIVSSASDYTQSCPTASSSGLVYSTRVNTALSWYNTVATEITGNAANDNTMPYAVTYIVVTI